MSKKAREMAERRKSSSGRKSPSLGRSRDASGPTKTQVKPAISRSQHVLALPEDPDNPSLLSPEALRALVAQAETDERALPAVLMEQAAPRMHSVAGIIDFSAVVCLAVAEGKLKVAQSAELRKWVELMYTCSAASSASESGGQTNYVQQLITLAGASDALPMAQVVDISQTQKKAEGE